MKILVVEDEETLRETLGYNLRSHGYDVLTAENGQIALDLARSNELDLVLLDVMLPVIDGFEVCRILRKEMNVPILMLTAKTEEVDKIVGLEVGADDYLTKPFSMRELLARVKAMQRRVRLIREDVYSEVSKSTETLASATHSEFVFDDLVIDTDRHEVRVAGQVIRLKPKEYELLDFLTRHKGIALSRELILERVWGWSYDGNSRTVDVHIRWLREKVESSPNKPSRIVTVRGIGYRFEG